MAIDVRFFSWKRKNPLGGATCRCFVRWLIPNLFKAKELSVSHADWPKSSLACRTFNAFFELDCSLVQKDLFSFEVK